MSETTVRTHRMKHIRYAGQSKIVRSKPKGLRIRSSQRFAALNLAFELRVSMEILHGPTKTVVVLGGHRVEVIDGWDWSNVFAGIRYLGIGMGLGFVPFHGKDEAEC